MPVYGYSRQVMLRQVRLFSYLPDRILQEPGNCVFEIVIYLPEMLSALAGQRLVT